MTDYSLYLMTRFYPPLPVAYSDLINEANHLIAEGHGYNAEIELPDDLAPKPRAAYTRDGTTYVTAGALLKAVRLY